MGLYYVAIMAAMIASLAIIFGFLRTRKKRRRKKTTQVDYRVGRPLLSETEKRFYAVLKSIAPEDVLVFPKVRVADVLQPNASTGSEAWQLARKRISIKHFDFIVCDKSSLEVRFVVELDRVIPPSNETVSRTNFLHKICNEAGLSIKKIRVSQIYNTDYIKRVLFVGTDNYSGFEDPVTLYQKIRMPAWRSYELVMSQQGFEKAANLVARREKQQPQIYVLVGVEGILKGQVIRIGCAKNGVFRRWFRSSNGHMNAFFWAVGKPSRFSIGFAKRYASYLLFLASLKGQKTTLNIISCESRTAMLMKERALTAEFVPIWDQYARSVDKGAGKSPRGVLNKPSIINAISGFGMADKLLTVQRKQRFDCWQGLPDIFAAQIKSGKLWE